jgi:hypothetical protein
MHGPVLYSANPWFSTDIAARYRGGVTFAWVCEYYDARKAPAGSAAALIAPSSNPWRIHRDLAEDYRRFDQHSALIRGYRKTFARLAKGWLGTGDLTMDQYSEITAAIRGKAWNIWRPVLYVIPRAPIETSGRLLSVPYTLRAAYGPELQIVDLRREEFDWIELETK